MKQRFPKIMGTVVVLMALLAGGCATVSSPSDESEEKGFAEKEWRIAGDLSVGKITSDEYGDETDLILGCSVGKFVAKGLLLQGALSVSHVNAEITSTEDLTQTSWTLGGGLRYYFPTESNVHPYIGGIVGIGTIDVDDESVGFDDSDTSLVLQGRAGIEVSVTESVAVDIGILLEHINDVSLYGVEDDITTLAGVVGFSIWL